MEKTIGNMIMQKCIYGKLWTWKEIYISFLMNRPFSYSRNKWGDLRVISLQIINVNNAVFVRMINMDWRYGLWSPYVVFDNPILWASFVFELGL